MKETVGQWPALAAIGLVAGLVAWFSRLLWQNHFGHASLGPRLGEVFLPMFLASAAYFGLSSWLKVGSAREMLRIVSVRFSK
jgi:hypothetical protein